MTGDARIAIIDDHALVADAVANALAYRGYDDVAVIDLDDAIVERVLALDARLVLVDLLLGDAGSGLDLVAPLAGAGVAVAVVTAAPSPDEHRAALDAGATVVLDKALPFRSLLAEIERVVGSVRPADAAGLDLLTAREADVLADLLAGHTAAEIVERRAIALTTVRTHIRSILSKLGVQSQLAAVAVAQRAGWAPVTSPGVEIATPRQS